MWITVTSFLTRTKRKKVMFSETALSFALKLSAIVGIFLDKNMSGTAQADRHGMSVRELKPISLTRKKNQVIQI